MTSECENVTLCVLFRGIGMLFENHGFGSQTDQLLLFFFFKAEDERSAHAAAPRFLPPGAFYLQGLGSQKASVGQ